VFAQVAAMIASNQNSNQVTLIVCNANVMNQWEQKLTSLLSDCEREFTIVQHHKTAKKQSKFEQGHDVVITTYQTLGALCDNNMLFILFYFIFLMQTNSLTT
jgi:SNF2 family DNA or RNA helicase